MLFIINLSMKETTLLKISILVSVLGVFFLMVISELSHIELSKISDITKKDLETKVKIQGKLLSIQETPGLYILTVTDFTSTIVIIVFKEDPLELKKNSNIEIEGKVTEYQGKLEIIADTIKYIN